MTLREEFLELLRSDPEFREDVRRQVLTDELLGLPSRLAEAQLRTDQRFEQLVQAQLRTEQRLETFQAAVDGRFEAVDRRFDEIHTAIREVHDSLQRQIDRLGSRWGIRNESVFRQTMASLLEKSFGADVQRVLIDGEEYDIVITNGKHILIEIAASVRPDIVERLRRKRELYRQHSGVEPARVILVPGSIHSSRALAVKEAGFEVVEPEEEAP